jgi:thymidylate kinase
MGVDGSGKSTLINKLIKSYSKKYKKIKYLHLRPYVFLIDKRTVVSDPHKNKSSHSKIISLTKIFVWLFIYKFFFLLNQNKKNQLIIFDRYAHDILIDKIRYRINLSNRLIKYLLNLFPEPHLWIILKAPISIIEKRKKEMPTKVLEKQMIKYINFFHSKKNTLLIDTNKNYLKNISLIKKKISNL